MNVMGADGRCLQCGSLCMTGDCPLCNSFNVYTVPRTPHKCPVCNGQRKVSTPPWVAGDVATYSANDFQLYDCPACEGKGIVWS